MEQLSPQQVQSSPCGGQADSAMELSTMLIARVTKRYYTVDQGFLRCFRDPIRVPRIPNRIP